MKDALLEIGKIIIPAVLSSVFVSFYYQKRLKRVGDFQEITKTIMGRLFEGAEQLYSLMKRFADLGSDALRELDHNPLRRAELGHIARKMAETEQSLYDAVNANRIYITSIIRIGRSSDFMQLARHIREGIEGVLRSSDLSEYSRQEEIKRIRGLIKRFPEELATLGRKIDVVRKSVLEGKTP